MAHEAELWLYAAEFVQDLRSVIRAAIVYDNDFVVVDGVQCRMHLIQQRRQIVGFIVSGNDDRELHWLLLQMEGEGLGNGLSHGFLGPEQIDR